MVAVVDDTPSGGLLRDQFASAFDDLAARIAARETSCHAPLDPAAWHPVDHSVVIVHPSAVGGARFSSPANDSALRWRENDQSTAGQALWMTAVRSALAAPLAAPAAPFQALAAFHDSITLLHRARPAATPEEQALLEALPDDASTVPFAVVAVATEDQSPGETSQYTTDQPLTLIVPAAQPDPARICRRPTEAATPRYEGWGYDQQLWPCTDPDFFGMLSGECSSPCLPRPVPTDDGGVAQCVATATYSGTEPCPADFGWLDPMGPNGVRAPRVDHGAAGDQRVCEVRQLEGAALASCRSTLDCADCEPGWCATEVPDLVFSQDCAPGRFYPPFRFVLGAGAGPDSVPDVSLSVICDEASTP